MTSFIAIVSCSIFEPQQRTIHSVNIQPDKTISDQHDCPESVLRVATLNLAHGRKDSLNQLFVSEDAFKENLDDVASALTKYRPQVVALQEADAESRWSGSFDHVEYLASAAEYPWRTHASNAQSWLFSYGTALLSVLPLIETVQHTFESSPPTLNKGFVLAQIEWPCSDKSESQKIDVVSVHLDFLRQSVRDRQLKELLELLSARMNPTIIMGDFNSEWLAEISGIEGPVTKSRFVTSEPEGENHKSYKNKRLDWILITKDMEFVSYRVLPDTLSDHAMVMADIQFKAASDKVINSNDTFNHRH